MSKIRSIAMAGATVASALGIGYFVQHGEPSYVAQIPASIKFSAAETAQSPIIPHEMPLELEGITLTSAMPNLPTPQRLVEPVPDLPGRPATIRQPAQSKPEVANIACEITASATPAPMASVDLIVLAPCNGNEWVTIHHNGMMFSGVTDDSGVLMTTAPALAENAVYIAVFANGNGTVAVAQVADLADYDRVVLQWIGKGGFQIHAREFGAEYGSDGHIWFGMDENFSPDQHGTIIRLGESQALVPHMAEVYTYPSAVSDKAGTVSMTIEAEVTANNCGRDVEAQTLEISGGSRLHTSELLLTVPECDAIGDFLVLNNLVDDMKIASN